MGYDGHFLFDNIGDKYEENNVPYLALRMLPALCGALVPILGFMILKEMGVGILGCIVGSMMVILGSSFFLHFKSIDLPRTPMERILKKGKLILSSHFFLSYFSYQPTFSFPSSRQFSSHPVSSYLVRLHAFILLYCESLLLDTILSGAVQVE